MSSRVAVDLRISLVQRIVTAQRLARAERPRRRRTAIFAICRLPCGCGGGMLGFLLYAVAENQRSAPEKPHGLHMF